MEEVATLIKKIFFKELLIEDNQALI